jgi:hypothetical protein
MRGSRTLKLTAIHKQRIRPSSTVIARRASLAVQAARPRGERVQSIGR